MARNLHIHYNTAPSEQLCVEIKAADGTVTQHATDNADGMHSYAHKAKGELTYRYALITSNGKISERHFRTIAPCDNVTVIDTWRSPETPSEALKPSAFAEAIFTTDKSLPAVAEPAKGKLTIRLCDPRAKANEAFCIVSKQFINWSTEKAFVMTKLADFTWQCEIDNVKLVKDFEFKFGIWDTEANAFARYEEGGNRIIDIRTTDDTVLATFDAFNYGYNWKCAGVAVPVFSLRTSKSRGCGEFSDIIALADWCQLAGLKIIQLLPINDTTATFSYKDSYPYNAISSTALHPSYISIAEVYEYYGTVLPSIERETALFLNDLNLMDYDRTREWKRRTLRTLFDSKFQTIIADERFAEYFANNSYWLRDYAVYAVLRDEYHTPNFRLWKEASVHSKELVDQYFDPSSKYYTDVMFRVFIQFHLELQLSKAIEYAHNKNIAIKGDLPIGISPNSVEAWVQPELFNFGLQAGAPPDFFSRDGQNWGFPIYNWDKMAEDGFQWWKQRLGRMQQFFDAFRIDHILGFFRIWAIPQPFRSGLMGLFAPSKPLSYAELQQNGFSRDPNEYTMPVVSKQRIANEVGEYADMVDSIMFDEQSDGLRRMKPEYFNPKVTEEWVEQNVEVTSRMRIRQGLANLIHEVLFVSIAPNEWHPRIMLTDTEAFGRLPHHEQNALRAIHDNYFYNRHNEFWKNTATERLEGILQKCNMLVCGEDLGMIPASVPIVMSRLQILTLELQRMPKLNWERYGNCANYQYMSVCATSSHDISSIRGWWEENADESQWYYNNILGMQGNAPRVADAYIVTQVVDMHLKSPSMLCINPIQDYAGMIDNMPHLLPHEERINEPANANHYWRYRMPFCIDEMATKYPYLHQKVRNMVEASGRLHE